jgi:hypothetical protein
LFLLQAAAAALLVHIFKWRERGRLGIKWIPQSKNRPFGSGNVASSSSSAGSDFQSSTLGAFDSSLALATVAMDSSSAFSRSSTS